MTREAMLLNLINYLLQPFTEKFNKQIHDNENVKKVIDLYANDKFTKIRFWDAPFIEVEKLVDKKGEIVDLGCGEGIFTNFLGISSSNRKVTGIELDKFRFKKASKGLRNVTFKNGDVVKAVIPHANNIILFHLLHHLQRYEDQEIVIKNCLSALRKNGKLIIVEVDKKFSFKYLVSWWVDCFLVPWLFEKRFYTPVYYRSELGWTNLFKKLGLKYKVKSLERNKPFTHIVYECTLI